MKEFCSGLMLSLTLGLTAWADDVPASSKPAAVQAYDPQHVDLSKASALGDKAFSFTPSALAQQKNVDEDKHRSFATSAFDLSQARPSALQNQTSHVTASSAFTSKAAGFNQSYATASFQAKQTSALAQQPASGLQNKSSALGQTSAYPASSDSALNLKPYQPLTPEDSSVLEKNKSTVLSRMSTVPNRPLTIDEVRDLINHGVGPYGDGHAATEHKIVDDGSDITPPPATTSAPKSAPALPPAEKN